MDNEKQWDNMSDKAALAFDKNDLKRKRDLIENGVRGLLLTRCFVYKNITDDGYYRTPCTCKDCLEMTDNFISILSKFIKEIETVYRHKHEMHSANNIVMKFIHDMPCTYRDEYCLREISNLHNIKKTKSRKVRRQRCHEKKIITTFFISRQVNVKYDFEIDECKWDILDFVLERYNALKENFL